MRGSTADAHSATMVRKVTATIHSCRLNGPSALSAARAALGASGVARTSGAMMRKSTIGSSTIAVNVGTEAATNHVPKPISRPCLRAISHPSGFAAIAVSQSADDRLRLAMPENIRKLPSRARCGSPGLAPEDSASETASGYKTPERAVLLGNAGAITASTTKMLYDSPSVDLPNTLTARWPIRAPRPQVTTPRATRNATMINRIVPLANPDQACAAGTTPVRTARPPASTDAVRIGRTPATTAAMAAAKIANRCHAGAARPSGTGQNHIATPRPTTATRVSQRARPIVIRAASALSWRPDRARRQSALRTGPAFRGSDRGCRGRFASLPQQARSIARSR